ELEGKPILQKNVDYYFVFRDRWIDLHASMVLPKAADAELFTTLDRTLKARADAVAPAGSSELMALLGEGSARYLGRDYAAAIAAYSKALEIQKAKPTLSRELSRTLIDDLGMAYGMSGDFQRAAE